MEKHEVTGRLEGFDQAAVCACGKNLADCACANGEECTCGGDPRLCGVQTVETLELVRDTAPANSARA